MLFGGIDIGSSGCKVSFIDETGRVKYSSFRQYGFVYSEDTVELDARVVLRSVFDAIKQITCNHKVDDLKTLSAVSFGEMFVLLDGKERVLCSSIAYSDKRGAAEAERFAEKFGEERLYGIAGAPYDGMYSLAKLLWIKKHNPGAYESAEKICLFADYVLRMLGADYHMDFSLAARTQMFDVCKREWSREIIGAAGIKDFFPKVVPSGTPVGKIGRSVANELKLPHDLILLAGGHDQSCAALGAGINKNGCALDGMGSNECIVPAFDKPMINDTMKKNGFACIPYAADGMYVTYAFNRTAGTVFEWYKKLSGGADYEKMFYNMPDVPTKLLFLPHFAGAATPYMDENAVGAVSGLTLATEKEELLRGIVEGLNYEIKINLECLKNAGFNVEKLTACGGLSQNDSVLQIKADILGLPIAKSENPHAGNAATAALGGVATGIFKNISEAMRHTAKKSLIFYPNEANREIYCRQFEKYKKMYALIKELERGNGK